jgi:2-oxo-4-hydroxy-4-carboxy--5-ureidoimidazoline (OHCU) decarboxylase
VSSLDELNAHLRRCCVAARDRTGGANAETVGPRFARDLTRVERAIRQARIRGHPDAARITAQADRLARQPPSEPTDTAMSLAASPLPDLSRFNRLLGSHPAEDSDE